MVQGMREVGPAGHFTVKIDFSGEECEYMIDLERRIQIAEHSGFVRKIRWS
jgi:hypothetical protein